MDKKLCPFRKVTEKFNSGFLENFVACEGVSCMAWNEDGRFCNLCSDRKVYAVEARVDTRYNL